MAFKPIASRATGCTGKRNFTGWKAAERAAKRHNRANDSRLGPYVCNHCHGIHLGNRSPVEMSRFNESNRPDARRERREGRALVRVGEEIE